MKAHANTQPSISTGVYISISASPMELRVSSIFQRCIESIVAGIPNVLVFLDDILITGKTPVEHQQNLYEVLRRLEKAGLKLGVNKCQFYMNSMAYLGIKYLARALTTAREASGYP